MRTFFLILGIFFCCFPYTQIIEFESYTQPYAILFCGIAAVLHPGRLAQEFPKAHLGSLAGLAITGIGFWLVAAQAYGVGPQELKSLLMYVGPIAFAATGFVAFRDYPDLLAKLFAVVVVIWILVGIIQVVIDPSFATFLIGSFQDTASASEDSGRGVLGLAPEPTHYGFHLLILAAGLAVLGKYRWLSLLCVVAALLLARSSSALLAVLVGSFLYIICHRRILLIPMIFAIPFLIGLKYLADAGGIPDSSRILVLLSAFLRDPSEFFYSDYSVNARIGGMLAGVDTVFMDYFVPHGLANQDWLTEISPLLSRYPWLLGISESGIPSGFVITVYQLGALAVLLLYLPVKSFLVRSDSWLHNWLLCIMLVVFMGQYLLSTPGFGLIYGFILAKASAHKLVSAGFANNKARVFDGSPKFPAQA